MVTAKLVGSTLFTMCLQTRCEVTFCVKPRFAIHLISDNCEAPVEQNSSIPIPNIQPLDIFILIKNALIQRVPSLSDGAEPGAFNVPYDASYSTLSR
jgi:hypothetical protein